MINTRPSDYTICAELEEGSVLLIQGYTGAYSTLPKELARKVLSNNGFSDDSRYLECGLNRQQLDELKQSGFLTDLDREEEEEFFTRIVRTIHTQKIKKNPLFTIIPSYECNFNCDYCFESGMRKQRESEYLAKRMNRETVRFVLNAIETIEKEKNKVESNKTNICFYGGEPFLQENKEIIDYFIREAKERFDTAFSAISNGYELDLYEEHLMPETFDNIQITLDGPPGYHNSRRHKKRSPEETYEKIARNVSLALDRGIRISIRMNIDGENIGSLDEFIKEIKKRGWAGYKEFKFTAAPVFDYSDSSSEKKYYSSGELSKKLVDIKKTVPELEMMLLQDEDYVRQVGSLFTKNDFLTSLFKYNYCSAPTNMFVFDPHGEVYPCMEKAGMPGESIGHFDDCGGLVFVPEQYEKWQGRTVAASGECRKCSYALFCGRGCANKAEQVNGTIYSSFCDGFKSLFNRNIAESYTALKLKN
jgi:uncharacterized protein